MKQFHALPKFILERYPASLCLPWLYLVFTLFEQQGKSAVKQCFFTVEPCVVFSPEKLFFRYQSGCTTCFTETQRFLSILVPLRQAGYVGCTSQRLQSRIKLHVTKPICSCSSSQKRILPARQCKSSTQA